MDKFKIAVIRVVTINNKEQMSLHGSLLEKYFPIFESTSYCILEQAKGIYNQITYEQALPKLIDLGEQVAKNVDGLIISCAADPAVKELKKRIAIPITGAGVPTAIHSLNFGDRVGVMGIEKSAPAVYRYILGNRLIAYTKPEHVSNTNDLQTERGKQSLLAAARDLKEEGVEVIALACTGMSTIGIAPLIEQTISLPVVDPVIAEGLYMYERWLARRMY